MLSRVALFLILVSSATAGTSKIDYVTYLGGTYTDLVAGLAVDASGNAYVAGTTTSPDFPLTSTALGVPDVNSPCAFITKLDPQGEGVVFSVCLENSRATALAMDASGNLYLTRSDPDFSNYFVTKLDPSATKVIYSTPIGGIPEAMAVDAEGGVYVTGQAGPGLATTPGAYQSQSAAGSCHSSGKGPPGPCPDAFILKLNPTGGVAYLTYLGGDGPDDAHDIAVDGEGNAWIAGETVSSNFPITPNALQFSFHGEIDLGPLRFGDAFVAELDPSGGKLLYSTYLGGSQPDAAYGLAVDAQGEAYVVGGTQSADFPTTTGVLQPTYNGATNIMPSTGGNAFVVKFDGSGMVHYSTYLGGPLSDQATAVVADGQGQAYVSQITLPTSTTIGSCVVLVPGGVAVESNPGVVVLSSDGSALTGSSRVGGHYLAYGGASLLYSAGTPGPYQLVFFTTPHAYQTQYAGGDGDAFIALADFSQPEGLSLTCLANAASLLPGNPSYFPNGAVTPGEIITVYGTGIGSGATLTFNDNPAPILYAGSGQINAVAPFGIAQPVTFVNLSSGGQTFGPVKLPVVDAVPALFTVDESGTGQAAIVNQDGTANSASNPAKRGSAISLYMTGVGQMTGDLTDGALGPLEPPFPAPVIGVSAAIGLAPAPVLFAGQAPGLIAGAVQVNVQVPQGAPIGNNVPITVYVGDFSNAFQAVTMAVSE